MNQVQEKPKSILKKKTSVTANEEDCESEETLNNDTSSITSLETGLTFDSTNNENTLTQTVKAKSPAVSKTNVGMRQTDKCGTMPGSSDGMWLDKMSMITIASFLKLSDEHRMQCDNKIGESFQVHTKVGMMKFKQSEEGLCYH